MPPADTTTLRPHPATLDHPFNLVPIDRQQDLGTALSELRYGVVYGSLCTIQKPELGSTAGILQAIA
ncbi:uncharacterized protein ColSpa_12142 [Colletotrichum spaethianum]|uniref:Uncharacterized protein n=1 Tax=Colletotrichum spaethianum TaxID=700344 RepID=A0AA37ULK4_9PEZI|nr:uncharacterized protein ColSpa_12142 [Colletotrichum spaethianum]GKT51961.1 hypothetical protein ColSpa_12142 [Colletotrichum spaethianum]